MRIQNLNSTETGADQYPEHVGSVGELAGRFAVGWGIAVGVSLWITGFWVTRASASRRDS